MLLRLLLLICALLCETNGELHFPFLFMACGYLVPRVSTEGIADSCLDSPCSSETHLATVAEMYKCQWLGWARAALCSHASLRLTGVPVSDVNLETRPPEGQVMEGKKLILVCSVAKGTGDITFLWYKGALGLNLGTKTQRSLTAEFEIPTARQSDAERYYCAADNGYGLSLSGLVSITVRIPVSRPVLTLRAPMAQAMVGDMAELHCEAQRGSPPILYRFYREDVPLESSSAPFGGGTSFNLSLTAEHSGNYSCEAANGLEAQRSEAVTLNVIGPSPSLGAHTQSLPSVPSVERGDFLTSGTMEVLLGTVCTTTVALLLCYWFQRKIGKHSARDPLRSPPSPVPQDPIYRNSPSPVHLQSVYENVNVVSGDEVYSLVYCAQRQEVSAAETPSTPTEDKVSSAIYSKLKKARATDLDYDDVI
ncbi:Fc receptor-like protein 1 isoform X2 [Choloepus didactylus]|uniref:Fc receptor-like protein 1 isoform X2 n=1 Tax=Choloepus didactylus TaxID=27675 RepID=UPI00189D7186|nr:Fc receptor-like protein 1 isoform X2 [Choloepus didactylus]